MIGVLSALMGIGGGQLSNLFMTFYGRPIHQAVATSSGLGVLISIPGALGYIYAGWPRAAEYPDVAALQLPLALGYVSLIGFILFVPTSIWTAPIGARSPTRCRSAGSRSPSASSCSSSARGSQSVWFLSSHRRSGAHRRCEPGAR